MEDTKNRLWDPHRQFEGWLEDIHLMRSYAASEGRVIPSTVVERIVALTNDEVRNRKTPAESAQSLQWNDIGTLIGSALDLHSKLSAVVAPATARSLRWTDGDGAQTAWWKNGLVLALLWVAGVALGLFTAMAAIDTLPELVRTQLSAFAASILGAVFYTLFTAHKYIVSRTFDPQYQLVYILRLVLGIVSGVILSNFGADVFSADTGGIQLGSSLLALIGGYSSEAVNQILLRISEILVTAVKGTSENRLRSKDQELRATKMQAVVEKEADRAAMLNELDTLAAAATTSSVEDVRNKIDDFKARMEGKPPASTDPVQSGRSSK